jgi:hypothetical protein
MSALVHHPLRQRDAKPAGDTDARGGFRRAAWYSGEGIAGATEAIAAIDKADDVAARVARPAMPGQPGALKEAAATVARVSAAAVASVPAAARIAEGVDAKGTLVCKSRAGALTAALKFAWLVKGPYPADPAETVRRLFLPGKDIGAAIQDCKTIMCAGGQATEGMTVDFDVRPRLNYWIALSGQKVQYSRTAEPGAFAARANDARHLAGRLAIDDAAAGGPKVDVELNVRLFKEFKQQHRPVKMGSPKKENEQ